MPMSLTSTSTSESASADSAALIESTIRTIAPWPWSTVRIRSAVSRWSSATSTRTPLSVGRPATGGTSAGTTGAARPRAVETATGSRTLNVAPCPAPGLVTLTRPPCSSLRWRTIARPSPSPPWRRVMVLSA